jgi:hypothetical protein
MEQRSTDAAAVADTGAGASVWSRRVMRYGLPALAAAALTTGGPHPVSAGGGGIPAPEENHVWGGCELSQEAVEAIQDSIFNSSGGEGGPFGDFPENLEVAFVVVYSLQENDGQLLPDTEGYTGPILCLGGFPGEGFTPFGIESTSEDSPIPPEPGEGDPTSVNILDLEEALILRYEPNFPGEGEPFTGNPEKRFCHTVDDNTDCFTVFSPDFF